MLERYVLPFAAMDRIVPAVISPSLRPS